MHFSTKSYLKSTRNHTAKQAQSQSIQAFTSFIFHKGQTYKICFNILINFENPTQLRNLICKL